MTVRARPGLVTLYNIRPGNGAGQFLQPHSPHGALSTEFCENLCVVFCNPANKHRNYPNADKNITYLAELTMHTTAMITMTTTTTVLLLLLLLPLLLLVFV